MNLEKILNERIADFAVLYFKLHRFHWFVQGPAFYNSHKLYEELYDETTELIDQFAERLLTIKGTPAATMKSYLALSSISEEGDEVTPEEIGKTLIKDFSHVVERLKAGIDVAEENRDMATADLFTVTIGQLEKHLWMLGQTLK
ncbi:MAG: DNA starvation/stationary phase protection protein [Defluviitaleaceae bacterium]|nr:DNA starvation/stationary phase protection protein [Defluviitaleaceae bacterium]